MAEVYRWLLVPRLPEPTGPVSWDEIRADGRGNLVEPAASKLA